MNVVEQLLKEYKAAIVDIEALVEDYNAAGDSIDDLVNEYEYVTKEAENCSYDLYDVSEGLGDLFSGLLDYSRDENSTNDSYCWYVLVKILKQYDGEYKHAIPHILDLIDKYDKKLRFYIDSLDNITRRLEDCSNNDADTTRYPRATITFDYEGVYNKYAQLLEDKKKEI